MHFKFIFLFGKQNILYIMYFIHYIIAINILMLYKGYKLIY